MQKKETVSLMNTDVKFLNKQNSSIYKKNYIPHKTMRFIVGMEGWFNIQKSINIIYYISRPKTKTHMTISVDAQKAHDKITSIFDKSFQKNRNTGKFPQPDKDFLQKNLQLTLYFMVKD